MKMFIYKGTDEKMKAKGRDIFSGLNPDLEYVVTIKQNRPIRSLKANAFYWMVINIYAINTGHTKAEIDHMFRMERHFQIVTYPSGKTERIPAETHDRDTKEFAIVCNNLLDWGRENFPEVIVPRREDATYIQWMEVENEYNKAFSGW